MQGEVRHLGLTEEVLVDVAKAAKAERLGGQPVGIRLDHGEQGFGHPDRHGGVAEPPLDRLLHMVVDQLLAQRPARSQASLDGVQGHDVDPPFGEQGRIVEAFEDGADGRDVEAEDRGGRRLGRAHGALRPLTQGEAAIL